jgi:hypothetical protein
MHAINVDCWIDGHYFRITFDHALNNQYVEKYINNTLTNHDRADCKIFERPLGFSPLQAIVRPKLIGPNFGQNSPYAFGTAVST